MSYFTEVPDKVGGPVAHFLKYVYNQVNSRLKNIAKHCSACLCHVHVAQWWFNFPIFLPL